MSMFSDTYMGISQNPYEFGGDESGGVSARPPDEERVIEGSIMHCYDLTKPHVEISYAGIYKRWNYLTSVGKSPQSIEIFAITECSLQGWEQMSGFKVAVEEETLKKVRSERS